MDSHGSCWKLRADVPSKTPSVIVTYSGGNENRDRLNVMETDASILLSTF